MGVTVNYQIDLGQIITVLTVIVMAAGAHFTVTGAVKTLNARFEDFRYDIRRAVEAIGSRIDKQEEAIRVIVGQVQNVIGRLESDRLDTRRFRDQG